MITTCKEKHVLLHILQKRTRLARRYLKIFGALFDVEFHSYLIVAVFMDVALIDNVYSTGEGVVVRFITTIVVQRSCKLVQ